MCALTVFIHVFLGGAKWVRPYLAVEMEPGLKWLGYLMWHLGTVSTLFLMAGFAAAAILLAVTPRSKVSAMVQIRQSKLPSFWARPHFPSLSKVAVPKERDLRTAQSIASRLRPSADR